MGLFKKMFLGGNDQSGEEKQKEEKQQEEKNFEVLKHDGIAALNQHQYEYAVKCFRKALELKDDLEIHNYLSLALIGNNELQPALEELDTVSKARPGDVDVLLRMANVAFMMEDYNTMSDICERAQAVSNDDPRVSYLRARACVGQGQFINAIALLTKAIADADKQQGTDAAKVSAPFIEAYLLRGQTLLSMGDAQTANKDADLILHHNGDNEDALLLMARSLARLHKEKEAEDYYTKVISANPFNTDAFKERGLVRLKLGDKTGAEEDARALLDIAPGEAAKVSGEFQAKGTEEIPQRLNGLRPVKPAADDSADKK